MQSPTTKELLDLLRKRRPALSEEFYTDGAPDALKIRG
jgi:hypothetical protein